MKRFTRIAGILAFMAPLLLAAEDQKAEFKTPADKLSYLVGMEVGTTIKRMDTEISMDAFQRGVKDSLEGRASRLTPQETQAVREAYVKEQTQKFQDRAEKNKKEGEAFLAENGKKKGISTTASGLQYEVLKEGAGATPKATDTVTVHYRGTLLSGTEFDSSYARGEPVTFPVTGVIPGWTEALQLMKVGGKYRLAIPSPLAYGEQGAGLEIGPNAALLFEVELLGIEKPKEGEPKLAPQ
jgi:FKBP-type peptidyl-prolyl cis-trans isomerase